MSVKSKVPPNQPINCINSCRIATDGNKKMYIHPFFMEKFHTLPTIRIYDNSHKPSGKEYFTHIGRLSLWILILSNQSLHAIVSAHSYTNNSCGRKRMYIEMPDNRLITDNNMVIISLLVIILVLIPNISLCLDYSFVCSIK